MNPLISAHQGCLPAAGLSAAERYRRAIRLGVDFVEFDVRRSRDGMDVIHHDDWTKSGRPIRDFAYHELTEELGSEALTLDELLDVAAGKVGLHLDLKEPGYEAEIARTMLGRCPVDEFVITSGVEEIRTVKETFPQVRVGLSIGDDLTGISPWLAVRHRLRELFPRRRIERSRADFIAVHRDLAVLGALGYSERHRIPAWVWTVDDEPSIARFLADRRVAAAITNRADIA